MQRLMHRSVIAPGGFQHHASGSVFFQPGAQRPVAGALVGKPPALPGHMHIELILADVDPGDYG